MRAPSFDARLATRIAPSARAMARPSVSMCALSDKRASEPATNAVTASTTTKTTVSTRAIQRGFTLRAAARRSVAPWS